MNSLSQKLTHLMGASHDGEIFSPEAQVKLLETQMRLVSPTGKLTAWQDDPDGYSKQAARLGLDNDAVLEEFGRYTQLNYMSGAMSPEGLHAHLYAM